MKKTKYVVNTNNNQPVRKRIFLLAPERFNFNLLIKENLEQLGYCVCDIHKLLPNFRYPNTWLRLKNCFKKTVRKDYSLKKKILKEQQLAALKKFFDDERSNSFDYTFVIRPDTYDKEVIELITSKAKKSICYQWDGFACFPETTQYLRFFEKVFVFDKNDLDANNPKLSLATNFWFDCLDYESKVTDNKIVSYMGTFHENRMVKILTLAELFKRLGATPDFRIHFHNKKHVRPYKKNYEFIKLYNFLSYKEYHEVQRRSSIFLDIQNPLHQGLSFRHFEALAFGKKIITDNPEARHTDFYHPNNVYILEDSSIDTEDRLRTFLSLPYQPINKKTIEKYSFRNWFEEKTGGSK